MTIAFCVSFFLIIVSFFFCFENAIIFYIHLFFSENEIKTSVMETPPQLQESFTHQEKSEMFKRKYPVTPTYKRENVVYE